MDLSKIPTEDLLAEISKRKQAAKLEREKQRAEAKRCYNCKHFGTVSKFGIPMPRPTLTRYGDYFCPFVKNKRYYGKHNIVPRCKKACEHFKHINEGTTL